MSNPNQISQSIRDFLQDREEQMNGTEQETLSGFQIVGVACE